MRLEDGSQVIIVGGGPSGSFTALHLLAQAASMNLKIRVTILEARDFNKAGPNGCNKCAGILSSGLVHNLERLHLQIPADVIQSELDTYILHGDEFELPIHLPEPRRRIISVYRGGGPRLGSQPLPRSFDDWLLQQAQLRGAEVRRMRVRSIQADPRPRVVTDSEEFKPDLLVFAAGINTRLELDPAFGYHPPRTEVMAQDEIPLPGGEQGNVVHIYFDHPEGLIFGGVIPKGRYTNISLLGHHLPPDAMQQFLRDNKITAEFPEGAPTLCGCFPRVAISQAIGFFSDRFVTVGDAAVTRLYKDGIGSAFVTAEAAAVTAIQRGVSKGDFAAGYQPACQRITQDNSYGNLLFSLWDFVRRSKPFRKAWMQAIQYERFLPPANQIHTFVLWGMFTGDASYRAMFWKLASLRSFASMLRGLMRSGENR
jgi:flavin-dependent dehydrogenase